MASALLVAACAGASTPRVVRGGPDADLAPRVAVRHVADQSSTLDVVQDASTGLPAISADGARVAFLFNDAAISTLSSLTFQIASTKTGKVEEAFPIVSGEDVLRELEDHEGKLRSKVDGQVRVANERLAGGRYEPMLVARGRGAPGAPLNVGDLESVLDGGRFQVRQAGVVQIDVDARGWADVPIGLGPTCTIRVAATLLAVDAKKTTVAVVIEQIGEGGSDACGGPRSVKVFALRSP